MKIPRVEPVGESDDFHDSSLIDVALSPTLHELRVVLSTPNEEGVEELWLLTFRGLLRLEFETTGDGKARSAAPLEVYSVYTDPHSAEVKRWRLRWKPHDGTDIKHVVLASSFQRGWGDRQSLEGIQVICREVEVLPAPRDYRGGEFTRPRIDAD